jgi:aconitate hydratase
MGIVPLQFKKGENADSLGLTGKEQFEIVLPAVKDMKPGMDVVVKVSNGKEFLTTLRFDTPVECEYFRHGGILHYVLRNLLKA